MVRACPQARTSRGAQAALPPPCVDRTVRSGTCGVIRRHRARRHPALSLEGFTENGHIPVNPSRLNIRGGQ
ncbi:hypothetical protein ACFFX0_09155 [Citricoccus parietis]|uniref:Uncharacterized protein n=1 Tax=Citricoccus parietis TaxID=592307 RepID=A0ABV5FYN7_9MICC